MKKIFFLTILTFCLAPTAWSYDFFTNGVFYTITSEEDATVEVTCLHRGIDANSKAYTGEISIPATVSFQSKQYEVTAVGDYAFYNCNRLTNISLPNTIKAIGSWSFSNCSNLISVDIPQTVVSLGHCAFQHCEQLAGITIPSSIQSFGQVVFLGIGQKVLYNADQTRLLHVDPSIESLDIPETVTSIESGALSGCSALRELKLPSNLTNIGSYAFFNCNEDIANQATAIMEAANRTDEM